MLELFLARLCFLQVIHRQSSTGDASCECWSHVATVSNHIQTKCHSSLCPGLPHERTSDCRLVRVDWSRQDHDAGARSLSSLKEPDELVRCVPQDQRDRAFSGAGSHWALFATAASLAPCRFPFFSQRRVRLSCPAEPIVCFWQGARVLVTRSPAKLTSYKNCFFSIFQKNKFIIQKIRIETF